MKWPGVLKLVKPSVFVVAGLLISLLLPGKAIAPVGRWYPVVKIVETHQGTRATMVLRWYERT